MEGETSRRREGEERGEREQARLRSELKSKETAYKDHQTQSIEYQKKLQEQLQGAEEARAALVAEVKELGEKMAAKTNDESEELATLRESAKSLESSEEESKALRSQLVEQQVPKSMGREFCNFKTCSKKE